MGFLNLPTGERVSFSGRHMAAHAEVLPYLQEALERLERLKGNFIKESIDMGRVIGKTSLVKTTTVDTIVYANRVKRYSASRFVMHRTPEDTRLMTVILVKNLHSAKQYKLLTAYFGEPAEKEPTDKTVTDEERPLVEKFWANHALIWDESVIHDLS